MMHHTNYLRTLQLRRGGMLAPDTGAGAGGSATDNQSDGAQDSQSADAPDNQSDGGQKTFTQEEVNAILARERAKAKKAQSAEIAKARSEGEQLARMSEDQRAEHERQEREADYNRRMAELNRRELTLQTQQLLRDKNIPEELAELIHMESAETVYASVETLEKAWTRTVDARVKAEVDKRFSRSAGAPPAGQGARTPMTMRDAIAQKLSNTGG